MKLCLSLRSFIYCLIHLHHKQSNPNLLEELELLTISVAIDTDIAKDAKLYSCLGCITSEGDYAGIQSFVLYSETEKVKCNKNGYNEYNEFIFLKYQTNYVC